MGSLARKMRRKQIREGQSQGHIMQLIREEVERNLGAADQLALEMSNRDLSAGTVWVLASLIKAIDTKLKWKHGSQRYYELLNEFNRQYEDLLAVEDKGAWVREAEEIANAELKIYFH